MAAVTAKAHGNAAAPGSGTWTVTLTGSPVNGDPVVISVSSDSTTNLVTGIAGLTSGTILFSSASGTGSKTLITGLYSGSSPVLTLSSAWGAAHGKLIWGLFDQTVYSGFGTAGTIFTRSSSQTTTTAPSTGSSAAPNLVFWWDKTTSQNSCTTGITDIENVLPNTGIAGSACMSTYDDASGTVTQTATYGIASSNGSGLQLPMVMATITSVSVTNTGTGTPSIVNVQGEPTAVTVSGSSTVTVQAGSNVTQSVTNTGTSTQSVVSTETQSQSVTVTGTSGITAASGFVAQFIKPANWPMNLAHFGGDVDWPPGLVLHAYQLAALWNSTLGFEVDVWPTTDGVWVVQHDNTTDTNFGTSGNVITSSTWASISSLTTTVGGYPIMRLDTLLAAFPTRVMMIDNKGQLSNTALLNLLDTYGGAANFIAKGFNTSTSWADAATARGYETWGYYYDKTALPTNQSHWSLLGMDSLAASSADWTAALSYGKPVIAHIIATAAQKTTAVGFGANGFMASGVQEVIPQTPLPVTITGSSSQTIGTIQRFTSTTTVTGAGVQSIVGKPAQVTTLTNTGTGAQTVSAGSNATQAVTNTGTGSISVTTVMRASSSITANGTGTQTVVSTETMGIPFTVTGTGVASIVPAPKMNLSLTITGVGRMTVMAVNPSNQRNITLSFTPLAPRWAFGPPPDRWQFDAAPPRWAFTEGT